MDTRSLVQGWIAFLVCAACLACAVDTSAASVRASTNAGPWPPSRAPSLLIQLSENSVTFPPSAAPGVVAASAPVGLQVFSTYPSWRVVIQASALTGDVGTLPPDRLLVRHDLSQEAVHPVAGAGYQSLDEARVVAYGGPTGAVVSNTLSFALIVEWTDRPGQYTGTIQFTSLVEP